MILTFTKKNDEQSTVDFNVQMSQAEMNWLVNFAIQSLMQIGAIAVNEATAEPQEIQLPITETIIPPAQVN